MQCSLCELPHQCRARTSPNVIHREDGSIFLQFQKSIIGTRQFYLNVRSGTLLTDSFTFGSGCNLTLHGYQLYSLGVCDIKVFISSNQHTDELRLRQINGNTSALCVHRRFCLIDWQAYSTQPLHLSGKTVITRLTTIGSNTCTLSSILKKNHLVWDGIKLITKGRVKSQHTSKYCLLQL